MLSAGNRPLLFEVTMSKQRSANKHYQVLQKVMPHLRRQGADARFGNKTWLWHDIEKQSKTSEAEIRAAIADLERRRKVTFELSSAQVKFHGPDTLNIARIYANSAKVPSTTLATQFRKHGVYLTADLLPGTAWMQHTHPNITNGREEVVLTLHQSLIDKYEDGIVRYSSLDVADDSWEKRAANVRRRDALTAARGSLKNEFRVIRVWGKHSRAGTFTITKARADGNYWRLEVLTEKGRMRAYRTPERVVQYDLATTKLGVPDALKNFIR
jgi:hypothetical protein